ncbi:MAG TPA: dihydrofolate reductase family protein [Bellilinea sp.]|nr:dihydrofolate reductase family protein [Bellilinea sp.]
MPKIIYFAMTSADGFIEDRRGSIGFHTPDAEEHAFINGLHSSAGLFILDARDYQIMKWWDTPAASAADETAEVLAYTEFWQKVHKHVVSADRPDDLPAGYGYSETLDTQNLRAWLAANEKDVMVSAGVAGQCLREGLLDEVWLMVVPVLLGAGLPVSIGEEAQLKLLEPVKVGKGWLFNRYAVLNK